MEKYMEDLKECLEVHITCRLVISSHGRLAFNVCVGNIFFVIKKKFRSHF